MQWHARCTHVQLASATLRCITRTVTTQLETNTAIMFLLLNGTLLRCQHRLRHVRPRFIGLIPSLPANTKFSRTEQNTQMAVQLRYRACPHIADNPPLPQACKEVLHPCAIEAMDIVIFLLGFTQSCPPNRRYNSVQAALISAIISTYFKIERKLEKNPSWNKKLVERGQNCGFHYLLTYKTLHCVHGIPLENGPHWPKQAQNALFEKSFHVLSDSQTAIFSLIWVRGDAFWHKPLKNPCK